MKNCGRLAGAFLMFCPVRSPLWSLNNLRQRWMNYKDELDEDIEDDLGIEESQAVPSTTPVDDEGIQSARDIVFSGEQEAANAMLQLNRAPGETQFDDLPGSYSQRTQPTSSAPRKSDRQPRESQKKLEALLAAETGKLMRKSASKKATKKAPVNKVISKKTPNKRKPSMKASAELQVISSSSPEPLPSPSPEPELIEYAATGGLLPEINLSPFSRSS
jgi:hypothetical protein